MSMMDQIGRAPGDPYYYTRLKARMERDLAPRPTPSWALAFACLLLVLNISVAWYTTSDTGSFSATENTETEAYAWSMGTAVYYEDLVLE